LVNFERRKHCLLKNFFFDFIDVCTIRLDFETFDIQGPTLSTEANAAATVCLDSLVVKVIYCTHHAEGLVDPKVLAKVTDFGYPRACSPTGKLISTWAQVDPNELI
jgi:hypothetical protein